MKKVRVYELAKQIGLSSKELIKKMNEKGLNLQTVRVYGAGHCVHPTKELLIFINFIVNAFSK